MWEKQLHQMCTTCLDMRIYLNALWLTSPYEKTVSSLTWIGIHFIITFCFCIDAAHTQFRFYISFCIHAGDTQSQILHLLLHSCSWHTVSNFTSPSAFMQLTHILDFTSPSAFMQLTHSLDFTETPNYVVAAFTFATASVFERLRKHKWHVNVDKVSSKLSS